MVSETYEPTRKEKQQAQQNYKQHTVETQSEIQAKDSKRLQKSTKDFTSL